MEEARVEDMVLGVILVAMEGVLTLLAITILICPSILTAVLLVVQV